MDLLSRDFFIRSLCFAHGLMVAHEDLLREAIPRSAGRLRAYYEQHLEEEKGHCEMLEADLASLGVAPGLDYRAAMLVGSQLYLIRHYGAQMLLGYMYVLESRAPSPELAALLTAHYGPDATRTIEWHARHDAEHTKAIAAEIQALSDPAPVWDNGAHVSRAMAAFLPQLMGESAADHDRAGAPNSLEAV